MILADFGSMPVYMGCVMSESHEDKFHRMQWGINSDGLLAIVAPPPLDLVYLDQHFEPSASGLWMQHHDAFANFLLDGLREDRILEIGGGSGLLAEITLEKSGEKLEWTILEPFLPENRPLGIAWIKGWFPGDIPEKTGSVLVATHVLEHATNPRAFIEDCAKYLDYGDTLAISWPNMRQMAQRGDLNMLNFEHLHFLPQDVVESMLTEAGFEVQEVVDFMGHSIFLKAQKKERPGEHQGGPSEAQSAELESLVHDYTDSLDRLVASMNELIDGWEGEIWLFGAHIFSQYLIARGLNVGRITGLLDNAIHKQGQRLYGTELAVHSPETLRGKQRQLLLVAAALYEAEILGQLRELNMAGSKVYMSGSGVHELD